VDAIGSTSAVVEAEVCAAVSDVLIGVGFTDFTIRLNHREVLRGLLDGAGVGAELHDAALVAIDKLDKVGADGVKAELVRRGVGEDAAAAALAAFSFDASADNSAVDARLASLVAPHGSGVAGLQNLRSPVALDRHERGSPHPAGPRPCAWPVLLHRCHLRGRRT
jgi:histidyl-tRNA synthetase